MNNNKINNFQAISCLIILSINGIVLSTSQYITNSCANSSLINALYVSLITFLITFIICLLSKPFLGKNLLDISDFLGGKILKFIVGILFIGYFSSRTIIFLRKISTCIEIVYFPMTSIIFILALFCICTGIISYFKNNSIFKVIVLVLPVLFTTIILAFVGNSKNLNFENVFPILGNGINATFFLGISNIFAFSGLAYILFLPSKLKDPEKITKISLISIIFSAIFLLFAVACILLLFSDTLTNSELFPLFLTVRYIEFGTFFQRLDLVFLFLYVMGFICVFSLNTFLITEIFRDITNLSSNSPVVFPYLLTIFSISVSIHQNTTLEFLENNVAKVLFFIFAIIIPLLILISANIKRKISSGGDL